jgi:hypothetical protein
MVFSLPLNGQTIRTSENGRKISHGDGMIILEDISGKRFGKWTVLRRNGTLSNGNKGSLKAWLCRCDCGKTKTLRGCELRRGNTHSCGCGRKNRLTHGLAGTPIYKIWAGIKKRSNGKDGKFYKNISMCEDWEKFENFYTWAKDKWNKGLDIDRIDTLKGYSPVNCRFVSRKKNTQNTKRSKIWIVFGKPFNSGQDAANFFKCSYSHINTLCHGRKTKTKIYYPEPFCFTVKRYPNADRG